MRLITTTACLALAAFVSASQIPRRTTSDRVEQAYRANNAGVAALERFDYAAAAVSFRNALAVDPAVHIARVNLAIALHYAGDAPAAQKEALDAAKTRPEEPRAWFVAGLAARSAGDNEAAAAAFERALKLDPADAAALTNLGQVYVDIGRSTDAIDRLTKATAAEPFNATALYTLARALIRAGRAGEGQDAMKRFLALRDAPYAVTYSNAYLQQGKYAEALLSTGSEPHLVDPAVPPVHFVDITAEALGDGVPEGAESIALADVDGDRDFDLLATGAFGVRMFERVGGSWTLSSGLTSSAPLHGALAADYDNDGLVDVLGIGPRGITVWRQTSGRKFEDATARASLGNVPGSRTAAFVDLDHDGDVDLVVAPLAPTRSLAAWRNNGNGTFAPFDPSAGLVAAPDGAAAIVPTDFDNGRDVDLLVAGAGGIALLKNLRDGRFEDASRQAALPQSAYQTIAAGDVNADGRTDFFAGSASRGAIITSDGAAAFRAAAAPDATAGAKAAQWIDYDADGALDLITLGETGLRVFRNTGGTWADVSKAARVPGTPCTGACALASADFDDDGDEDLVTVESSRVRMWRNDGPRARAVSVTLAARVSNRSAAGARIEMRAGSLLRRFEASIATPAAAPAGIVFGLGARAGADVIRVVWPSGIVQAELVPPAGAGRQRLDVAELDRKPSSCPYLFTWNGSRFEFVTDFLGGGELGYWLAPGVRNIPDPEEYVRIRGDQLVPRDGRYELRVTNELEEALFVDRLSLIAVTHRAGTEVHPNEGLFSPPFPTHRLVATRDARTPDRVVDEHGHDVRAPVERVDRRAPADFGLERLRGYAQDHHVELSVPAGAASPLVLLLTAWTDYAFSSDNVAASQAGLALRPPVLEIADRNGGWTTLVQEVGIPVGRPQTLVVDLTGRVPEGPLRLRLRTNMRIYWDRILVATAAEDESMRTNRLPVEKADLRWRGYSAEVSPDGREPFGYDYSHVLLTAPWKLLPGRYTREGDVRELVTTTDDRFVVSRPGDEIALSFAALPPPPAGWTRTFLLHADGYSKEMDPNSASPDAVAPLPFRGMKSYPHDALSRPMSAAQREYVERYNTRIVTRPLAPLTSAMPSATTACCTR